MKRYAILLLLPLLLLAGCRSPKNIATPAPSQKTTTCGYERVEASFDCQVQGVTVNGLLRNECDSIIWISVSKLIELGRARFTPDSVQGYLLFYNRAFSGNYDDLYQLTGYRTSFSDLQTLVRDAYISKNDKLTLNVAAKQYSGIISINIKRITTPSTPLRYPFRLPDGMKMLN